MSPQVKITDDIDAAANLFALAFRHNPLTAFVFRTPESTWPVSNIPLDIIGPKMIEGVKYKLASGAELVEADNFAAAAIWFPPGVALSSSSDDSEAIVAFREMASRAKKTFMGDKKYYYLNMVARHPDRIEPGVVRALFEPYIARAREEKVPIWLEAVSEHSKQVYEHFGFKTVAILRMGEGKASPDGELQEGGEGIILWAMILE